MIVSSLHGMVIYAVYYRKRYFLVPWMAQVWLEIVGAIAFGSLCGYDYFTCAQPCCVEDMGCFSKAFLINACVAGAYSIFLLYVETLACLYYRHCIKIGDIDMFLETAAKMATPLVT